MLVKFRGTTSRNDRTGAITLDGRPTIEVDGVGAVTDEEYVVLVGQGMVLDVVDVDELGIPELKEIVAKLGIEAPDTSKKADLVKLTKGADDPDPEPGASDTSTSASSSGAGAGSTQTASGATT